MSRRVEEKVFREISRKNKMSQDIKKEVIEHIGIESRVHQQDLDHKLAKLQEDYRFLLERLAVKQDKEDMKRVKA